MRDRLVVAPGRARLADVCSDSCRDLLERRFDVHWNTGDELDRAALADRLPGATALLTSWGSPPLDDELLALAPELTVIGHAAGSVKSLVPRSVFDRDIAVFSAAPRIAASVGEYCLASTLTLLRRLPGLDAGLRRGGWKDPHNRGGELTGRHVGLIGASSTARAFTRLLAPFAPIIDVYDPYLSADTADSLGLNKVSLPAVMSCEIVSVHLPATSETDQLIGAAELATMPDGAIFINSARGQVVDYQALTKELESGRISAALDVFPTEPPPATDRLLQLENVLVTPHVAGDTVHGHLALMEFVGRDVIGFLDRGDRGRGYVDARAWDTAA